MEAKRFPVRVLLTVTTDRLLTEPKGEHDNGISDLYDILGWMTNDSPFTHQLPRFCNECKPWLLRWFQELKKASDYNAIAKLDTLLEDASHQREPANAAIEMWLKWMKEPCQAGIKDYYEVPRIPMDDHAKIHPYDELVSMRGTDEGIVVIDSSKNEQG